MSKPENPPPTNSDPKRSWISNLLGLPAKTPASPKPSKPEPSEPEDHSSTEIQYDSEGNRLPPPTDEAPTEDSDSSDT